MIFSANGTLIKKRVQNRFKRIPYSKYSLQNCAFLLSITDHIYKYTTSITVVPPKLSSVDIWPPLVVYILTRNTLRHS